MFGCSQTNMFTIFQLYSMLHLGVSTTSYVLDWCCAHMYVDKMLLSQDNFERHGVGWLAKIYNATDCKSKVFIMWKFILTVLQVILLNLTCNLARLNFCFMCACLITPFPVKFTRRVAKAKKKKHVHTKNCCYSAVRGSTSCPFCETVYFGIFE